MLNKDKFQLASLELHVWRLQKWRIRLFPPFEWVTPFSICGCRYLNPHKFGSWRLVYFILSQSLLNDGRESVELAVLLVIRNPVASSHTPQGVMSSPPPPQEEESPVVGISAPEVVESLVCEKCGLVANSSVFLVRHRIACRRYKVNVPGYQEVKKEDTSIPGEKMVWFEAAECHAFLNKLFDLFLLCIT